MDSNTQTPQSSWEQLPDTGTHFKIGPDLWVYQRSAAPFPLPETWPDHPTFQANKAAKVKADSLAKAEPSPQLSLASAAPTIADKPTAQPTLEWSDGAQPRSHFVPPPAVPLAASPAKPVAATPSPLTMALPPSMVMANNSKEIATEPPRDIGTTPAPKPIVARDASPEASDPWAKFPEVDAKSATGDDPWAKFPIHEPTHAPALNWSDVPGQMLRNAPASAANLAANLVQPILHPIDTVTNIADVAAGGLRGGARKVLPTSVFNALDSTSSPENNRRIEDKATAVGQFIGDRYGSAEGIKRTLATDPVGAAADAAMVLTGGGGLAARAPGAIGSAGQTALRAASAIDPIANTGRVISRGGGALADMVGTTTGAGARPLREAAKAGFEGNTAFTDNMRGEPGAHDVVSMAHDAVQTMRRDASVQYTADMAATKAIQTPIDVAPIFKDLDRTADTLHYKGIVKDPVALKVHTAIADKLNEFMNLDPAERTAEAFDAFKQSIGAIKDSIPFEQSNARRVAGSAYNTVKGEIVKQSPSYAQAMGNYGEYADELAQMTKTMSISDKAMPDTTLRKLQSTMRNNVNTNYGQREVLLDRLAQFQPDLPAALAGQSLNTWAPRGLARQGISSSLIAGGATMNPLAVASIPFASPRLMGEAAYGAGRVASSVSRAGQAAGVTPQRMQNAYLASLAARVPFAAMGETRPQTDAPRQRRGMGLTQPSR